MPALDLDLDNPYPDDYTGQKIEEFVYLDPLVLRREKDAVKLRGGRDDADYLVAADYRVSYKLKGIAAKRTITVPRGMITDLASVPRPVRNVVSQVGPHLEASIVHDFLYLAWQDVEDRGAREADWRFADALMMAAMIEAKVSYDQRFIIGVALAAAGWEVFRKPNPAPRYWKFW